MKKRLLNLVLTLVMIMSLFTGMGITASASNTEAIPVDEAIGLYEYPQDRYFVENIDDEDDDGTHWRYAYMTAAEGDAYLETLENATVGSVVAPQNSEEIINGFIPFVRASNDHDRLVILKVLDPYAGSSATTYSVQSYAYFNLGDEIDSIDFTIDATAIPEMVPGQALATQDDYSVFINFMVKVLSFVDADKLDQERSGVTDMVAKAPGGEWARVAPTDPIQAGYTYGVIVEVDGYWESVSGNAYYRAYFADRGAGVTVRCTNGDYNVVTADASLGDVTDTATEFAFVVELVTVPGQGGGDEPEEEETFTTIQNLGENGWVKREGNTFTITPPSGVSYFAEVIYKNDHGDMEGYGDSNFGKYNIIDPMMQMVGSPIVTNASDLNANQGVGCNALIFSGEPKTGSTTITLEESLILVVVQVDPTVKIDDYYGGGSVCYAVKGVYAEEVIIRNQLTNVNVTLDEDALPQYTVGGTMSGEEIELTVSTTPGSTDAFMAVGIPGVMLSEDNFREALHPGFLAMIAEELGHTPSYNEILAYISQMAESEFLAGMDPCLAAIGFEVLNADYRLTAGDQIGMVIVVNVPSGYELAQNGTITLNGNAVEGLLEGPSGEIFLFGHVLGNPQPEATTTDLTVTVGTQTVVLKDTDGDGFYEIDSVDTLYAFAAAVNSGNTAISGELTTNITVNTGVLTKEGALNGDGSTFREWTPIGSNTKPFEGSFIGNGYTVSGLYFNDPNVSYVGLFGNVTSNAANDNEIAGVGVVDSYFNGNRNIGGVVGYNTATVTNCYNEGSVISKNEYAGGVVGRNLGTVVECYNEGTINGNNYVGGVVGANDGGVVTKSYNTGKIHGENAIGGVVAYNTGSVTVCYNTGAISGSVSNIGGVVGENAGNIEDCYNVGTISGYPPTVNITAIGGVAGLNEEGTVINCYYLNTCGAAGEGTAKTEKAFKSGEVTYLLNNSTSEGVLDWYQLITIPGVIGDDLPQFNNNEYVVYYHPREAGTAFEYSNHKHEWVFELKAEEEGKSDAEQHTANQLIAYCTNNADGECHWHGGNGGTLTLRESPYENYKYYNYKIYDGSKADVYYEYSNNWYFTEDHTMEIRYYKCDAMKDPKNPLAHDHTTALDAAPVNAGYYCIEITYTYDSVEYELQNYYQIMRQTIYSYHVGVSTDALYDGENHIPDIWINIGRSLVKDIDYTVKFYRDGVEITDVNTGFTDAGVITIEITGIGNYTGTVVKTYEIEHPSISDSNIYHFYIELDDDSTMYHGDGITFDTNSHKLEVFVSEYISYWKDLIEGTDYTVKFYRNGVETTDFTNAGEIQIVVTGINNYTGEVTLTFDIYQAYIDYEDVTLSFDGGSFNGKDDDIEIIYNGNSLEPEILVTVDGNDLTFYEDYTYIFHRNGVSTSDLTNAGEITLILRGVGNYAGWIEITYTIKQAEITDPDVSEPGTVIYNQTPQMPVTDIVVGGLSLEEGRDYLITYTRDGVTTTDIKNIGEIIVTIEGIGNYFGTVTKTYIIEPATITDPDVTISGNLFYDTNEHKSDVFVTVNGLRLEKDIDFTVTYTRDGAIATDFTNVGEITVTVEGINNYIGTVTKTYTIEKNTIVDNERYNDDVYIEGFTTFTGSAQMPEISVILRGTTLVEGRDYTVTYMRNGVITNDFTNEGTITVTIDGIGNYTGSVSGDYVIRPALINFDDVYLSDYDVIYNTYPQVPTVSVYDDYTLLKEGRDYLLTYTRNGVTTNDFTNAGTIIVTVTGIGNYSGAVEETYVISKAHLSLSLTSPVTVVCPGNKIILSVYSNSSELPVPSFNSGLFSGESISADHDYLKITVSEDFVFGFQSEYEITIIATYAETDNYFGNSAEITLKVRACGDCDEAIADLEWALEYLDAAMKKGDADLSTEIANLNTALTNAKAALEKADADNKAELVSKIETADKALLDAITAVQNNLDNAKAELDKAIADGDTALDGKISNLNAALESAKAALEATDAANKTELEGKITSAQTSLQAAIDQVQTNLDSAKAELDKAIADLDAAMKKGDADLSTEIANLNTALTNAKAALEKADADNKAELVSKIETADKALLDAITAVQNNLDNAKAELDKAIADGDTALDGKISNLNAALESAKAALEAADAANKTELEGKITSAQTSLQAAIDQVQTNLDDLKAQLEKADADNKAALEAKDAELQTFTIIVCVIASVAFCGCGTIAVFYIIDKKKKI